MTDIKAAEPLTASSLPQHPLSSLCRDYVDGFCRRGDQCPLSHLLCVFQPVAQETSSRISNLPRNVLSSEPRRILHDKAEFETDGPGHLSAYGPRHDNDYASIHNIQILPTTDEVLSARRPYMPEKDGNSRTLSGVENLLDLNFRHLRYDNTEPIIDVCYHAIQYLQATPPVPGTSNCDDRMQTPRNLEYSMFREVEIFEAQFREGKGVSIRVSFACPEGLRGNKMYKSTCLEEGMLTALVGFDRVQGTVSVCFLEVVRRESTMAMKQRNGNELRASCLLTLADPNDLSTARRLLLNRRGVLSERFVLVDFPKVLLPGFSWCLERLKSMSQDNYDLPFSELIAPITSGLIGTNRPPQYEWKEGNTYNLASIRKESTSTPTEQLTLDPDTCYQDERIFSSMVDTIKRETTLDEGQAQALCENLCRGLAFTQGPPGTGKTYLGVALVKALLASRQEPDSRPILVVCMTNHALDSFLGGLRSAGLTQFARLGRGSKELWTAAHSISALSRRSKQSIPLKKKLTVAKTQAEGLWLDGSGLSEALNKHAANWQTIRGHVQSKNPEIFQDLSSVEHVDEYQKLSNLRVARQAGGFAYEYWASGGDLQDIESLISCFDTIFGQNDLSPQKSSGFSPTDEMKARNSVADQVRNNARKTHKERSPGAWTMSLEERKALIRKWEEDVGPSMVVDQLIEIHQRYRGALSRVDHARDSLDKMLLEQQDVIGLTTTACAKFSSKLSNVGISTVICEEAGEVMEAQSLCTLFSSVKHAIFIGDPLQLRAHVNESEMAMENSTLYRLDQSLFERMMYPCAQDVRPFPTSQLNIQRRMHPTIADLMRVTLYPRLKDGDNTKTYPAVAGMADRLWWLDHKQPESRPDPRSEFATSYVNSFEVDMVHGLVRYLVNTNEYSFGDIAVLTPYNGQLAALNERLSSTCSIWLSKNDKDILDAMSTLPRDDLEFSDDEEPQGKTTFEMSSMLRLATIDNFQGEEAKIVILSTVRSNADEKVGFLKTPNRINVACSRAKHGFFIIGNASLMRNIDCRQCLMGEDRSQSVLLCSHTLDVQSVDQQVVAQTMLGNDNMGGRKYPSVDESLDPTVLPGCPKCQAQADNMRRYSSTKKMLHLSQTLDDLYLHFGRDMSQLMRRIFNAKYDLKQTRQAFRDQLGSGLMAGRANRFLVASRVDKLRPVQTDISGLRDEMYSPFEKSMIALSEYLGSEELAISLRPSGGIEAGTSNTPVPCSTPLSNSKQQQASDGFDDQHHSSESDSDVSGDQGFIPDNAITRDIIRAIKEREPLPGTNSSWAVPPRLRPFNVASKALPSSSAASGDFIASNLPFKARLDSLFYRCRLVVFEESLNMLGSIQAVDSVTDHSKILADGIRTGIIDQANDIIKDIDTSISDSRSKNLKRLEVELRLIQFALHTLLRSLNTKSGIDIEASADKAIRLCQEYPDTAGIFLADCLSVRQGVKPGRYKFKIDLYKREANTFWKMWAGHDAGCIRHCVFGHPYSAYTFSDCPECGRREEPRESTNVDYGKYLNEDAFLAKMLDKKLATSPTKTKNVDVPAQEEETTAIHLIQEETVTQQWTDSWNQLGDTQEHAYWKETSDTSQHSVQLVGGW